MHDTCGTQLAIATAALFVIILLLFILKLKLVATNIVRLLHAGTPFGNSGDAIAIELQNAIGASYGIVFFVCLSLLFSATETGCY